MRPLYRVDRLRPSDADNIARVERAIYPPEHRAGRKVVWAQLEETECEGENLSLGLFYGDKLVGFLMLFVLQARRRVCEYFDVELPPDLDPGAPILYFADVGVLPHHRRATSLFNKCLQALLKSRSDLQQLPLDAFATDERSTFWTSRVRLLTSFGWELRSKIPFNDSRLRERMYWLSFAPQPQPERFGNLDLTLRSIRHFQNSQTTLEIGVVRSITGWMALQAHWDRLLIESRNPTVLQSYTFLKTWWSHFEFASDPFIVVAKRNGVPIAILPLHVTAARNLGKVFSCLTSIGEFIGAADFLISQQQEDIEFVSQAMAEFIAGETHQWDCMSLQCEASASLLRQLQTCLKASRQFTTRIPSVALAQNALPVRDVYLPNETMKIVSAETPAAALAALADYWQIERAHPAATLIDFRLRTSAILSFCRDLALQCSVAMQLHFMYWYTAEKLVTACFGLSWNGTFYPLRSLPDATAHRVAKIPFRCITQDERIARRMTTLKACRRTFIGLLWLTRHLAYPIATRLRQTLALPWIRSERTPRAARLHTFQMFRW